jgi:hypothetical protein
MSVGSREHVLDGAVVVELQTLGLRQRPLQAMWFDRRGEVEECASDRCDRDAFVGGGVTGIEGA